MTNTTKRQHYIWKKYLKRWITSDSDNKLYVLRKELRGEQNAIEYCKLENIGFEKFFYDMTGFTNDSVNILIQLLAYMQKDQRYQLMVDQDMLKDANVQRDFIEKNVICVAEDIDNQYNFLDMLANKNCTFYKDSQRQAILNRIQQIMLDTIFDSDVTLSDAELNNMFKEFFNSPYDEDLKYEFNKFFWMQYYRSPKVLKNLKTSINEAKQQKAEFNTLDVNFFANMFTVYCAVQTALNLTQNFITNIYLFENNTNVPFVTCDTPIINITNNGNIKTSKKHLFYYPISPIIAMLMVVEAKIIPIAMQSKNRCISFDKNAEYIVKNLNEILALECTSEIYSNDKKYLEMLKPIIKKHS